MIHLTADMRHSIGKNFMKILERHKLGTSLPMIEVDEQNEEVTITSFVTISAENVSFFNFNYSYPKGVSITDVNVDAIDSKRDRKVLAKLIKRLNVVQNEIDAMVIPYIKEEF